MYSLFGQSRIQKAEQPGASEVPLESQEKCTSWASWGARNVIWAGSGLASGAAAAGGFVARKAAAAGYAVVTRLMMDAVMQAIDAQLGDKRTIETELDLETKSKLKILDPKNQLGLFSASLAALVCSPKNQETVSPDKNNAIIRYAEFVIHRALANLACTGDSVNIEEGQLFTNILGNLFTVIPPFFDSLEPDLNDYVTLCIQTRSGEYSSKFINTTVDKLKKDLEAEQKKIEGLEQGTEEYRVSEALIDGLQNKWGEFESWHEQWDIDTQGGLLDNENQTEWLTKKLRALLVEKLSGGAVSILQQAGFAPVSIAHALIYGTDPHSSRFEQILIQGGPGFGGLKNILAEFLLDFYVEVQSISTLSASQQESLANNKNHEIFEKGIQGVLHGGITRYMAKMATKKVNDSPAAPLLHLQCDSLWITKLFKSLGTESDSLASMMIAKIVQYIAPRIVEVIEHLALSEGNASNILESALLNGITLFGREIEGKEQAFSQAIKNYDTNGLKAEAYEMCKKYLQEKKGLEKKIPETEDERKHIDWSELALAKALTKEDIKAVLELLSEVKRKRLKELFGEGDLEDFFKLASGRCSRDHQRKNLDDFTPLSKRILEATGLDNDLIIGFGKETPFKFLGLDLEAIRKDIFPVLVLECYRAVDVSENSIKSEGAQILSDALKKFQEQLSGPSQEGEPNKTRKNVVLLQTLLRTFSPKLSDADAIGMLAKTISRISSNWFEALNLSLREPSWGEKQGQLKALDPSQKLPKISRTLAQKVLDSSKKSILKMLTQSVNGENLDRIAVEAYDVIENSPEIQRFAENYLSLTIQRVIGNLALSSDDNAHNGLLSNAMKSVVAAIKGSKNLKDFKKLEEKLGKYSALQRKLAQMPEKMRAKCPPKKNLDKLHEELLLEFSVLSQDVLAAAGLRQASDLHLVLVPFGSEKIQELVWDQLNENLPAMLIDLCCAFQVKSLLKDEQKGIAGSISGHAEVKEDSAVIAKELMPTIFGWMGRQENRFSLGHTMKDLLDGMGIEGLEREWIEELLEQLADIHKDSKQRDDLIQSVWTFLENIVGPRLFAILEHVAVQNNSGGNFLQRLIVNSIDLAVKEINGKDDKLKKTITKYDEWGLIAEAYDWRNRYLKEKKGVKAEDCTKSLDLLKKKDCPEILNMGFIDRADQKAAKQKKAALIQAIRKHILPEEKNGLSDAEVLMEFFRSQDSVGVKGHIDSYKELVVKDKKAGEDYLDWLLIAIGCEFRDTTYNLVPSTDVQAGDLFRGFSAKDIDDLKEKAKKDHLDFGKIAAAVRRVMPEQIDPSLDDDLLIKKLFASCGTNTALEKQEEARKASVKSKLLYDLRDDFLVESKGINRGDCKKMAETLTEADLDEFLVDNDLKKDQSILEAAVDLHLLVDFSEKESKLLQYLRLPGKITAREMQTIVLRDGFGPFGDQVLALTGLTTDKALSLPGATGEKGAYYSLQHVREVMIPQTIMNLYRDMSDFKGRNAENMKQLKKYCAGQSAVATDLISFFSNQIAVSTRNYLKNHGKMAAELARTYFPNAEGFVKEAVEGIASADNNSSELTQSAINEVTGYIEGLVKANLTTVLVGLAQQKAFEAAKKEAGMVESLVQLAAQTGQTVQKSATEALRGAQRAIEAYRGSSSGPVPHEEPVLPIEGFKEEKQSEQIPPEKLLENVLRHIGRIFGEKRAELNGHISAYRTNKALWEADKKVDPKKVNEESTKFLRQGFLPLSKELIALSGLTSKDLYAPSGLEETVWKAVTENVLPDMLAQFYLEMVELERVKGADEEELKGLGMPHGPDIALGLGHYSINLGQSIIALGGKQLIESFFPTLVKPLEESKSVEGQRAARALEQNANDLQEVLGQNLEDAVRSPEVKEVLSAAAETIATPIMVKRLISLGKNVKTIQEKDPSVLMSIAKKALCSLSEHFERIQKATIIHRVKNAYDLTYSQLLSVVTSDTKVLEYVSLMDSKEKATKIVDDLESQLKGWFLGEQKEADLKRRLELEKKAQEDIQAKLTTYLQTNWTDGGKALEQYLEAERKHRIAQMRLADAKHSWFQKMYEYVYGEDPTNLSTAVFNATRAGERALIALEESKTALRQVQTAVGDSSVGLMDDFLASREYQKNLHALDNAKKYLSNASPQEKSKAEELLKAAQKVYADCCDDYNLVKFQKNEVAIFFHRAIPNYVSLEEALKDAESKKTLEIEASKQEIFKIDEALEDARKEKNLRKIDELEQRLLQAKKALKQAESDCQVEIDARKEKLEDCKDEYKSKLLENLELIDLTERMEYLTLVKNVEEAESNLAHSTQSGKPTAQKALVKAQEKLEKYRLNYYFKPYASKLLKFVDMEECRKLKFSDKLPISLGDTIVDQSIAKLPSILNNIYTNLTKPETLLGFMESLLMTLEKSDEKLGTEIGKKIKESTIAPESQCSDKISDAASVKNAAGKMVYAAVKMMPTGFENLLFNIPGIEDIAEDNLKNAVGDLFVEYLNSKNLQELSHETLKASVGSLLPTGSWNKVTGEFTPGQNPFPLSNEQKVKKPTVEELRANVQKLAAKRGEIPIRSMIASYENKITETLGSYLEPVGQGISDFFKMIVRSLYSDASKADQVVKECGEFFQKVKDVIGKIAEFLAIPLSIFSIIFWKIVRTFLTYKTTQIVDSFSRINPERALMQVTNIVMNEFGNDLEWYSKIRLAEEQQKVEEEALKAEEQEKVEGLHEGEEFFYSLDDDDEELAEISNLGESAEEVKDQFELPSQEAQLAKVKSTDLGDDEDLGNSK